MAALPAVSFELFPPASDASEAHLQQTVGERSSFGGSAIQRQEERRPAKGVRRVQIDGLLHESFGPSEVLERRAGPGDHGG